MKRTIAVAILMLGTVLTPHAGTDFYDNITKRQRSDAELRADGYYCDQLYGMTLRNTPPTAAYLQSMLSRGWRFNHKRIDNKYVDHRGLRHCEEILGGYGNVCSWY
jgi:hypothetical protein